MPPVSAEHWEGVPFNLVGIDELHVQNGKLYKALQSAGEAKVQPIEEFIVTTAAVDTEDETNIWLERHRHYIAVLEDPSVDPRALPVVYMPGPGERVLLTYDEPRLMELARRVNPGMGVTFTEESFVNKLRDARRSTWLFKDFCRRRLNYLGSPIATYMERELWDACSAWSAGKPLTAKRYRELDKHLAAGRRRC